MFKIYKTYALDCHGTRLTYQFDISIDIKYWKLYTIKVSLNILIPDYAVYLFQVKPQKINLSLKNHNNDIVKNALIQWNLVMICNYYEKQKQLVLLKVYTRSVAYWLCSLTLSSNVYQIFVLAFQNVDCISL